MLVLKGGCQYHPGGKENTVSAHHAVGRRFWGLRLAGAIREAKKMQGQLKREVTDSPREENKFCLNLVLVG